jgi:Spy/CpxP family protein refolding chaperone
MRTLHRLLAVAALSLPLIAAGAIPAAAGNNQGNQNDQGQNGQGQNGQGGSGWAAPEIDPGLLGGAVALLAGGLLILRERRRA